MSNDLDRVPEAPTFDLLRQSRADGTEFWSARDLMGPLGYGADWRNFAAAIDRARTAAVNQGLAPETLFVGVTEKGAGRPREDVQLARFAAYLVAMNGDPRKPEIAAAQSYFAVKTRQAETRSVDVDLVTRRDLALMVLAAEDRADREALARSQAEARLVEQAPAVEYHEKFVAERDDIITIDNFASQWGTTGPKVRKALEELKIAVRRSVGRRWSQGKGRMVDDFEWRPRQGRATSDWFVLRPQHNAPRLHNGQVRQTLYVRQFHADALAAKLGLSPVLDLDVQVSGEAA